MTLTIWSFLMGQSFSLWEKYFDMILYQQAIICLNIGVAIFVISIWKGKYAFDSVGVAYCLSMFKGLGMGALSFIWKHCCLID